MNVKELREFLEKLPESCDELPIVSFQAQVELDYNQNVKFVGFEDIEMKKVKLDIDKVRIN